MSSYVKWLILIWSYLYELDIVRSIEKFLIAGLKHFVLKEKIE